MIPTAPGPRRRNRSAQLVCAAQSNTLDGLIFVARRDRMFPGASGLDLARIVIAPPASLTGCRRGQPVADTLTIRKCWDLQTKTGSL